jgi:hypothetical protein
MRWEREPEGLDAPGGAVNDIMPARHGLTELLTLVGAVRRLAFARTLPPSELLGRIRDRFGECDGLFDGEIDIHKRD